MTRGYRVAALPGEGIGPEVVEAALTVLDQVAQRHGFAVEVKRGLMGKPSLTACGDPFPAETAHLCAESDGILLGAVTCGLLELRQRFDLFANLRPICPLPALSNSSPLQPERLAGVDILMVRELVSGIYFGPAGRGSDAAGDYGYHTMRYHNWEINRVAQVALQNAQTRRQKLTVAHKQNALPQIPWVERVLEIAKEFPTVEIQPMLVDNLAMQLVINPAQFDVILAGNLFGDILSDIGGAIVGSIGLLGSASLNAKGFGLYEPIHGTAPDIVGRGIANPLGAINSLVLMLHQWGETTAAQAIEQAELCLLTKGYRTADLYSGDSSEILISTQDCVAQLLQFL